MCETWIAYNACAKPADASAGLDWISEAAVEDEVAAVASALTELGLAHRRVAVADPAVFAAALSTERPGLVFNLCEGLAGDARREMHLAALFELFDIPFTGNRAFTLALALDKIQTKRVLAGCGLPTPAWRVFRGGGSREFAASTGLAFPLIAKPSREDASLGIGTDAVSGSPAELAGRLDFLFQRYRQPILIEEYIEGREFNLAVLERGGKAGCLPVSEIDFSALGPGSARITSYEAKWVSDSAEFRGTPPVCPARLDEATAGRLSTLALEVFSALDGKDYGRVDFRMDGRGGLYVLEYNPNPDISPEGGFARALTAAGLPYREFTRLLIENNVHPKKEAFA